MFGWITMKVGGQKRAGGAKKGQIRENRGNAVGANDGQIGAKGQKIRFVSGVKLDVKKCEK